MKSLNSLSDEIDKYGRAKCDLCNKGYYEPLNKEAKDNSCYMCSYCNDYITFEKYINVDEL